jgi:hypothetical protein
MNPRARAYVLLSLGIGVLIVATVGLFNFLVDPYNRFGNNRLGVFISAERESKPTEVRRYPHNALLIGNSRMAMIPADRLESFHFFNAAFGGGTAEEQYYFLEHYAAKEGVVVMGIDLGQCDPPASQGDIFARPSLNAVLDNLLSLQTLEYSVRTIFDHRDGKPATMRRDGSFNAQGWFELYDRENSAYVQWQLDGLKRGVDNYTAPPMERMAFYRKIAELLRERKIACVVVVPPFHEALAKYIQASATLPAYQQWRRELGSIFPVVVDLSFGPDCAAENFFKSDVVHFKPEVGVRLFNAKVIPVALEAVRKRSGVAER